MSSPLNIEDEKNNLQPTGEPRPLSGEAPSQELEIDPKKKPADKKVIVNFRDKNYIKKTVETPKETSQIDNQAADNNSSGNDDLTAIRNRLSTEPSEPQALNGNNNGGGMNDPEAPDEDDCEMYADMAIELIDWLMIMLIQWYGKDPKEEEYRSDEKKKNRLKKMLAKMLMKMGKKYPVAVFFFGALILMYVPAARKAHTHKQKVEAEKAAQALLDEASATKEKSERNTGKRRSIKSDSDITDGTLLND